MKELDKQAMEQCVQDYAPNRYIVEQNQIRLAFKAGCEHKSKEMEETAIGFAEWIDNTRSFDTEGRPAKELFKLYQDELGR